MPGAPPPCQPVNADDTAWSRTRCWWQGLSHRRGRSSDRFLGTWLDFRSSLVTSDTLAEWLRRRPAKPMGSPRVGSNPTGVETLAPKSRRALPPCAWQRPCGQPRQQLKSPDDDRGSPEDSRACEHRARLRRRPAAQSGGQHVSPEQHEFGPHGNGPVFQAARRPCAAACAARGLASAPKRPAASAIAQCVPRAKMATVITPQAWLCHNETRQQLPPPPP